MSLGFTGLLLPLFASGVIASEPGAESTNDSFIAGYAAAVLELEFNLRAPSLQVKEGVITIGAADLAGYAEDKIIEVLSKIHGVKRVEVVERLQARPSLGWPVVFPSFRLFRHLEADPRWPHFSAAYQYYVADEDLRHVAAVSLGETLGLFQDDFFLGGQWQVSIQGAVFAIFDMTAASHDLVNADYWVGLPFSYRCRPFSLQARVFHQSSHLGDEFLLRNQTNRINFTYESVDLKLSYDLFGESVRVYGGGGFLFDQEPSDLEPWSTQAGLELKSPRAFLGGFVRPLVAADFQNREENAWDTDICIRGGVQLESPKLRRLNLQLLIEYYRGHSPNGQFFERDVEYGGLGIHFFYE